MIETVKFVTVIIVLYLFKINNTDLKFITNVKIIVNICFKSSQL